MLTQYYIESNIFFHIKLNIKKIFFLKVSIRISL